MACRAIVLISGNGSNLQAIIDAWQNQNLAIDLQWVLSNQIDAYGLQRAKLAGIATHVLSRQNFSNRQMFDNALAAWLDNVAPDLIILAGFMHILAPDLVARYQHKMLNIHPSLLPELRGLHTHQRALDSGLRLHGASVHFVTPDLDSGPVVIQAKVPILEHDTAESLGARVLQQEHQIYPLVIKWFADGRLQLQDHQVFLDGEYLTQPLIYHKEQYESSRF